MSRDVGAVLPEGAGDLVLHASAVARDGKAVLILGASGAGKSGLALRMMALGAELVADDRVVVARRGARLVVSSPPAIAGLVEARGVGILQVPFLPEAELRFVVDLDHSTEARMPQSREVAYLGVRVRLLFGRNLPNLGAILSVLLQNGQPFGDERED